MKTTKEIAPDQWKLAEEEALKFGASREDTDAMGALTKLEAGAALTISSNLLDAVEVLRVSIGNESALRLAMALRGIANTVVGRLEEKTASEVTA